ncbi:hypothetical protein ACG7TL_005637 [Trametes sanguinea]
MNSVQIAHLHPDTHAPTGMSEGLLGSWVQVPCNPVVAESVGTSTDETASFVSALGITAPEAAHT